MKTRPATVVVALVCAGLSVAALRAVPAGADTLAKTAATADDAWERGDYVGALNGLSIS